MALTKVTGKGITCSAVTEDKLGTSSVTTNKIGPNAVTSAKINNGTVTTDDLASTLDLSSKTLTLPSSAISFDREYNNIGLLGFKMAVNEGLTVFNLVDGVVDEFNDESGTDEAEGSNDNYCATCDFYKNANDPVSYSAGFTTTSVTEPDTSTAGTNPTAGSGTFGSFCVPACMTSVNVYTRGAGGASQAYLSPCRTSSAYGGGGGFSSGSLGVTPGRALGIVVGEGGHGAVTPDPNTKNGGLGGGGGE